MTNNAGRLMRGFLDRARRVPMTLIYTAILTATGIYAYAAPASQSLAFQEFISTNLDNLSSRPLQVLLLSLSTVDVEAFWLFFILAIIGMASCELWLGKWRTAAVFVGANIGVTLLVAAWIRYAISAEIYLSAARSALDYGVSYGLLALLFMLIARPPRVWQRLLLLGLDLLLLALLTPWTFTEELQFDGLGHLVAALIGSGLAIGILIRRRLLKSGISSSMTPTVRSSS